MLRQSIPRFRAVAIGVSTGGVQALQALLGGLSHDFPLPLLIVQHISPDADGGLVRLLGARCALCVKEADEQEEALSGTVYLAPPNYHLLVERDGRLALSADAPVSYARPSIDVLFESAADAFGPALIGVILTGANFDGSRGLARIKRQGGIAIVQDPAEAEAPQMPQAALAATAVDQVLSLAKIAGMLSILAGEQAAPTQETVVHA